jgi:competence protein ComEC
MTLNEALEMNQWNQHGLLVIAFIRESLALALAVNIFALPLTLFHFNQFPWMSLLFNLFYPLLVSLSFCLLFTGLLFEFLPPLSKAIHFLNGHLTHFILQIAYQTPSELDGYLQVESLAPSLLILYLTGVTVAGFYWKEKMKTDDAFFFI